MNTVAKLLEIPILVDLHVSERIYYVNPHYGNVFAVYFLKNENRSTLDAMKNDDLIGRQSIITKDAAAFNFKEPGLIVLVEGSGDSLELIKSKFGDLLELLKQERAMEIYTQIKEEEKKADEGMGFLFG